MPTSKLSEDEINKKILKILNGLPELDIETAFAILEEENGKLAFSDMAEDAININNLYKYFDSGMIGTCHVYPVYDNETENELHSIPSPKEVLIALFMGSGFHYSYSHYDKSIYVLKPLRLYNQEKLNAMRDELIKYKKYFKNSSNTDKIRLLQTLVKDIEIKRLQ